MGSLKDDMKGLREDCQPCEKTADGEQTHGSDSSATPQGLQMNTSQVSEIQGDRQTKLHSSSVEDSNGDPMSKESVLSRGGFDIADRSGSQECTQTEREAEKSPTATQNDVTVSSQSASNEIEVSPADRGAETDQDTDKKPETDGISVPVPPTPDVFDPCSPAPFGQHHMRTQVSLDVVQCRSAATSPMTPPGGGNSFFFPSAFGKSGPVGSGSKDAELQVGHQVEFCSVATSPMTPKTPMTTAFPELVGKQTQQKMKEESKSGQEKSFHLPESPTECQSERTKAEGSASKEVTAGSNVSAESSVSFPAGATDLQVTLQDGNQQCKQQRMGSMDQDITILVTHHGNTDDEEEEEEAGEKAEPIYPIETEMVKIDEFEEFDENSSKKTNNVQKNEGKDDVMKISAGASNVEDTSSTNVSHQEQSEDSSELKENKDAYVGEELIDLTKAPIPESPAPFGFHNIRTQVSLEVVQCHSAATSPMTPPEGDQAFSFPTCLARSVAMGTETKDAELQVCQQVEFRSIATAPMTPRTPTTTAFPEIQKEASKEETAEDEEETRDVKEQASTKRDGEAKEEEELTKSAEERKNCKERDEEKCEEPVQEVSWDEKGMTWEVYGAVVEVAVLGTAIQKHLEKQVKKQKRQPSMPPPPPLNPSATPATSDSASGSSGKSRAGKRGDGKVRRHRRNPFRLLLQNMQQPHCCTRAHSSE